ncbi:unnamed protein product [Arabis nemorensis]|uniref:VQ domain-containing protein n=1 Tax=Arabis nemorensis TaxID=586526 RepID=A0A565CFE5_9BRAS|nr:unnamed protein product [Arabis nemorensis]
MNNSNSIADQWLQHQSQEITPCFNANNMTSSSGSTLENGGAAAYEAGGRRSRASRRAIPTTLLNANPSNFRALVQKFTGRSAGGESNRRKGPVTLDFGSPTTVSKEAIFPVSCDRSHHDPAFNRHVSNEQHHVTWSGSDQATTSYQLIDESSSAFEQDHGLLREYSENSSFDGLEQMDYYHDFHRETATLEEFMMRDLDL